MSNPSYPDIRDPLFWKLFERWQPESLLSVDRLLALYSSAQHIVGAGIPGALVECGVYRGGGLCLVLETLVQLGATDREIVVFDTFDGFPDGTQDMAISGDVLTRDAWVTKDFQAVTEANIDRTGYPRSKIELVRGPVETTVPGRAPAAIALLHLDTDYYESTLHELTHLWPRVSRGGVLIIDDYGHFEGCRRAVDEYFETNGPRPLLHRSDYTGRIGVKT
jgi:hypothetical protein